MDARQGSTRSLGMCDSSNINTSIMLVWWTQYMSTNAVGIAQKYLPTGSQENKGM